MRKTRLLGFFRAIFGHLSPFLAAYSGALIIFLAPTGDLRSSPAISSSAILKILFPRRGCRLSLCLGAGRGSTTHRAGSFAGSRGPTRGSGRRTGGAFLGPVLDPSPAARRNETLSGRDCWRRESPSGIHGGPTPPTSPAPPAPPALSVTV